MTSTPADFVFEGEARVLTPALVVYHERVEHNLGSMLEVAGSPAHLRPHVKTHKMPALVRRQVELGITKFKCATLAEASMAAEAGARDVLLAYPPVGPAAVAFAAVADMFPAVSFSALIDDSDTLHRLAQAAADHSARIGAWLDVDVGQHRTGIAPGSLAVDLYRQLVQGQILEPRGLHVYDGHLIDSDPETRRRRCDEAIAPALELQQELCALGLPVPAIVAGGSPTFPIHAVHADRECSPGTTVLWDFGYADRFPDLPFVPAAAVLTRVISRPSNDRLTLDLGHKGVAAENPQPRARLVEWPDAIFTTHSEEHLVAEGPDAARFQIGDVLHAIPRHICPTVALYDHAVVVRNGALDGTWPVTARTRLPLAGMITF
jgi:D-serine deaminase-like pyridoxal phosphate-dependent protein